MSDDVLWEDGHSIFRPSYSATFLNCEGSLIPSMSAEDKAGWEAAEGTIFHELIAVWQKEGRPDHWLGEHRVVENFNAVFDIEVVEDMFSYAEECLAHYADIPGDRFYETRVDISSITPIPKQGGTADLAICSIGFLDIIDWKYGKGVQVWAYKNTQILLYAWGFFEEFDWIYHFKVIRLHIAQPRFGHYDVWEITREELIEFAEWAKGRMAEAWIANAPRRPSPKACQWCKVRNDCAALEMLRQDLVNLTFPSYDEEPVTKEKQIAVVAFNSPPPILEPPVRLSTMQLARIISYRKLMESWFKDAFEELLSRGLHGEELHYFKVVNGRSRRQYVDEDEAVAMYERLGLSENDLYQRKLKSPNQMEPELRALGIRGNTMKAFLRLLAPPVTGAPTLVINEDARDTIPNIVDETFIGEDDEESVI